MKRLLVALLLSLPAVAQWKEQTVNDVKILSARTADEFVILNCAIEGFQILLRLADNRHAYIGAARRSVTQRAEVRLKMRVVSAFCVGLEEN